MDIKISGPGKRVYCGEAEAVSLRTTQGEIQILPGHTSYMAEIGKGLMEIHGGQGVLHCKTSGGIIYNHKNKISIILTEPYEPY